MEHNCKNCKYCYESYNRHTGKTGKFFCVFPAMEDIHYDDVGDIIGVLFKKDLEKEYNCEAFERRM